MNLRRRCVMFCCVLLAINFGIVPSWAREEPGDVSASHVEGANTFALELYAKLAAAPGSIFLSPISIHTALAMAHAGARGATAGVMQKTLHLPPQETASASTQSLMKALTPAGDQEGTKPFALEIANALWTDRGFPVLLPFTRTLTVDFHAEVRQLDFAKARAQACEVINGWAKEKTRGKIQNVVSPTSLPELTRLVLTNAIYFKSAWEEQFSKGQTREAPFHVSRTAKKSVPLMTQEEHFGYWETDRLHGVEIPYTGRQLSMVLLVPKEIDGLALVEKNLSLKSFDDGLRSAKRRAVELFLPRFRTESTLLLRDVLSALGMAAAFSPAADFSGMTSSEELYIDAIVHKSFIAVDEDGTEAAAVTVLPVPTAAAPPAEPVIVRADRPFLYAIRHNSTGAILFLGRFAGPPGN